MAISVDGYHGSYDDNQKDGGQLLSWLIVFSWERIPAAQDKSSLI